MNQLAESLGTFRRRQLDRLLDGAEASGDLRGDVLDVGGERNRRGVFVAGGKGRSWCFLNIDPSTKPDICASAEAIPLEAASIDTVIATEVLEHVENPEKVLRECRRVLRPGGTMLATLPYLVPTHADPHDYQRWTKDKIRREVTHAGFSQVEIQSMGGIYSVLADVVEYYCQSHYSAGEKPPLWMRVLRFLLRKGFYRRVERWDAATRYQDRITTGFVVRAKA